MEATEKKILLEQLRELTVIVDLQEKEIEELKKSAADVEEEKERLQKKKREIEQDQKLIDRMFMDLGESAGESLQREKELKNQKERIELERQRIKEQREELKTWEKDLTEAVECYTERQKRQDWNSVIMFSALVLMAVDTCLIRDSRKLAEAVAAAWHFLKALGSKVQIPFLGVWIGIVLAVGVIVGIGIGTYRYLSRYADEISMYVTYVALYAAELGSRTAGMNSVVVFLLVEGVYLLIRIKKDAWDFYSPYSRY